MLRDKLYATIKTESLLNIVGNLVVLVAKLSQEKSGQMHPCTVINFACTVNTFHNDLLVGSECDKYFSKCPRSDLKNLNFTRTSLNANSLSAIFN